MTFLELCQETRRRCGVQGSGPPAVTGQVGIMEGIVKYVSNADVFIQSIFSDWKFLWSEWPINLAVGAYRYVGPVDLGLWDIESFVINKDTDYASELVFIENPPKTLSRSSDSPTAFWINPDNSVIIDSLPAEVETLSASYWKKPYRMTENSSISPIPSQYHDIIVWRACIEFAEEKEHTAFLQSSTAEYNAILPALIAHSAPNQSHINQANPPSMVIRPV